MIKRRELNLKKRDKKGDMQWYIVGFVVAALALVLLVLIATKGLGWFSDLLGLFPGDISNHITKCKGLVGDNKFLDEAYCEVKPGIKTPSGKRDINCELAQIRAETSKKEGGSVDRNIYNIGLDGVELLYLYTKRCKTTEESYCNGLRTVASEKRQKFVPSSIKINDYTCVQVFDGTFAPPVNSGKCESVITNTQCYKSVITNGVTTKDVIINEQTCVNEGCVWDIKESRCFVRNECNIKTTSAACVAVIGCTWTATN